MAHHQKTTRTKKYRNFLKFFSCFTNNYLIIYFNSYLNLKMKATVAATLIASVAGTEV